MTAGRTYRERVLVLDKTKLRETDLIYTLLARDGRQIRAVGKGARKPGSRLAARCEVGCTVDMLIARGRSLDVVAEATLVCAPFGAAPELDVLSAGTAIVDVARACCFEDAEDPFVFPITERALAVLGGSDGALDGAHLDLVVAAYVFKLLAHLGYYPDFSACVLCGDADVSYFSATAGGLVCASCASTVAGAEEVDATLVGWFRALMSLRFDDLAGANIDAPTAALLLAFSHAWAATHLDVRLRALEFLLGV